MSHVTHTSALQMPLAMEKGSLRFGQGLLLTDEKTHSFPQVWEEQWLSASFKWGQPMTACLSEPGQVSSSASVCDAPSHGCLCPPSQPWPGLHAT